MRTAYIRIICFFLVGLFLQIASLPATAADDFVIVRGNIKGKFTEAPADMQAAIVGLVTALRGDVDQKAFGPVLFEGDLVQRLRTSDTTFYQGFDVTGVRLSFIGQEPDKSQRLLGIIDWADKNKRAAATAFMVKYRTTPEALLVSEAAVDRVPPNQPRVVFFVVEQEKLQDRLNVASEGYLPLLKLVAENAVRLDKKSRKNKGMKNYLVFGFSLDRLGKGEHLDFIVGTGDAEQDVRPKQQKLIDYSGWPVLVMGASFDLWDKIPPVYRVFYTPSIHHPLMKPKPVQVARFTLKNR